VATPSISPFPETGDLLVDLSTTGHYWSAPNKVINWSISDGWFDEYWTDPDEALYYISAAFDVFSSYIDIDFNYVGYWEDPAVAYAMGSDINLAWDGNYITNWFGNNTLALGLFPTIESDIDPLLYQGASGDIFFNLNSQANDYTSYAPGSAAWQLLIHEIGHTLGLKHTHDDGGTGRPTYQELGFSELDEDYISIMSYSDELRLFDQDIYWDPATPMAFDVLGLQYIYGPNMSHNAGDDVHQIYRTNTYSTIWDASGSDIIDASNNSDGWDIELPVTLSINDTPIGAVSLMNELQPTTLYWLTGEIEGAVGSYGADSITGNTLNNGFMGLGGNDYMDGGEGFDFALFTGASTGYTVTAGLNSTHFINGQDGYDELLNVERLYFDDDYAIALDIDATAGNAYRIYKAAFDRQPDLEGLGYWIDEMDQGAHIIDVADSFIRSTEFESLYGSSPSDQTFVDLLYQNVLDRAPDQAGYDYWLDALASGATRAQTLANFSESAENQQNVIGLIENGITYDVWG